MENKENKYIGACWIKDGKNGKYMSGNIEIDGKKTYIVIFKNHRKQKENQPDYNILLSEPKKTEQNAKLIENNNKIAGIDFSQDIDALNNIGKQDEMNIPF